MATQDSKPVPPRVQSLIGKSFGRWHVLGYAGRNDNIRKHLWFCRCECGTERIVQGNNLKSGQSKSCGCRRQTGPISKVRRDAPREMHGMSSSPEYTVWRLMIARCYNPKHDNYKYYGERGVEVDAEWLESFQKFYEDMGPRPSDEHTIDRVDSTGNYTPDNCRWATHEEQQRNRSSNLLLTYEGRTQTAIEWAEEVGINYHTLINRVSTMEWSVERALTEPIHD